MKRLIFLMLISCATASAAQTGEQPDPFMQAYQETGGFVTSGGGRTYAHNTMLRAREAGVDVELRLAGADAQVRSIPDSFDWGPTKRNPRNQNIMSPIRDQGDCGSCWAFGTTAVLEAWINAKRGRRTDLSEEYLVRDCCIDNLGQLCGDCNGGFIDSASDFLVNTGTMPESCFPYTATDGVCSGYCPRSKMVTTDAWSYVAGNWWTIDIDAIKEALVRHGPVAASMDVYKDFYNYDGGIYRRESRRNLGGHCITITGYVDNASVPGGGYFIVRNSWGTDWGVNGYSAVAYDSNCDLGVEATVYHGARVYTRSSDDDAGNLRGPNPFPGSPLSD
jgi:C1A family cysteine protease